ncbi:retrovirus-related pol polyprotein from transposon TNT 1-94 [Tanacetum coccineum]
MKEVSKESGAKRKKSLSRKGTRSTGKRQKMELDDEKEDLKGYFVGNTKSVGHFQVVTGGDNKPPMLEKHLYDSWKSRMELYMLNRPHGRMILASVEKGPLVWPSITEDGVTRLKEYIELTPAEAIQADCDIKAINIILQGLPTEIYALVSQHRVAKDLWEKIKLLMQGTSLTKQERECKLYDEFDKFTYKKGESLHEYYLRFTLLLNDMNIYKMPLEQFQVNTKFLNTLPDEWSKFVTDVKLVKDLHTTNVDQLHAYLQQHERHANEVRLMHERNSDPLALVASHQLPPSTYQSHLHTLPNSQLQHHVSPYPSSQFVTPYQTQQFTTSQSTPLSITYPSNEYQSSVHHNVYSPQSSIPQLEYAPTTYQHQQSEFSQPDSGLIVPVFQKGDDPIDAINHMMSFLTAVVTSRYPTTNNQLRTSSSNPRQQATIYDGKVNCAPFREEDIAFLADPGLPDTQTSQTVITHNAAYQSRDLEPMTLIVMKTLTQPECCSLANLSGMAQMLKHKLITENSNSSAQQDALILSMFEQLNTQVMNCTNVNLEYKSANKALTTELDRYKEEVKDLKEMQNVENSFSGSNEQYAEIERLKQTLSKQVQEKDSLMKTVSDLKNDLKMEENKNIDREIALEKKIKQLDNIIFKRGQSAQTVHMMTKSKICYDHSTKQAIGFEKPFYLKKVRESKPKLYDGNVILKMDTIVIPDSDETLMLCEESRSKMLLKEQDPMVVKNKVNTKPINYAVLNNDYNKRFVRQSDLYSEHAYWKATSVPPLDPSPSSTTNKVEVPKELPKVSMVNTSLKELKRHLAGFDQVVKERTTATAITEGTWGEISDLNAKLQEQGLVIAALKNELRKLKGKALDKEVLLSLLCDPKVSKVYQRPSMELLSNISRTCPSINNFDPQLVAVTPRKKDKKVRLSKSSSVKFGNDQAAKIMGYGDYQIGNVTISRVYYIEGLGHNLFFVGQLCDSNLEVAFRQHTCFIRNLEGVDLLTGSRGDDLYTLSLGNIMASSPICLLSKASKTKSWLWHRRLFPLNLVLVIILQDMGLVRGHCGEYDEKVGNLHETSVARSPQQNGVVERRNRTLIEYYAKAPLFLWAEANLGKLQPKADIGIFIGYAPTKKAFWIYNRRTRRIIETIHVDFDELTAMASEHSSSGPALHDMTPVTISSGLVPNPPPSIPFVPPSRSDWDLLFQQC